jgi:trk system potassium uptake protein TrkA
MGPLSIDAYINPRATTVSSILRHIRHGRVRASIPSAMPRPR